MSKLLAIDPAVLDRLRSLPKNERVECLLALCDLVESFGQPHVHSGLGIRKLGAKLFECRGNRSLRFVFQDRSADLYVSFLGDHDEIKALLRRGRYG
ncbi:MAG: hypothetical protein HW373_734 [Deltaproteobacteria bacterium]|nr:hypothetical protein [Deltaproteobacteria bacterium]